MEKKSYLFVSEGEDRKSFAALVLRFAHKIEHKNEARSTLALLKEMSYLYATR